METNEGALVNLVFQQHRSITVRTLTISLLMGGVIAVNDITY